MRNKTNRKKECVIEWDATDEVKQKDDCIDAVHDACRKERSVIRKGDLNLNLNLNDVD